LSTTLLRAFARPRYAVLTIVLLLAGLVVPVALTAAPASAVTATGGSARFPYVQWISWGANGADLTPNASGDITTTETIPFGGQNLVVTCTIDNIARTRGSDSIAGSAGKLLESYASGSWRGDGLDELYNIGGTGVDNTMAVGVKNIHNANTVTFDFACSAELVQGSTHTPVTLAGLVMGSAESSVNNGTFQEYIGATISNTGTWRILDRVRGTTCTQDDYAQRTAPTGTTSRLVLQGAANTTCEANTASILPNPMSVAFMDGVSSATNVTLAGRGNEAIALGVVVNMDFGDAPSTYGTAGALSQGGFSGGEPPLYGGTGSGTGVFTMTLANQSSPVLRLGSAVDYESDQLPSAAANGDDTNGSDDEDGVTLASNYSATAGSTVTVSGVSCNASAAQPGYVAGWIDFNANGVFDSSEKSTNTPACPTGGGTVNLTFTAPNTAPPLATQPSFARFRIAPTTADLAATGIAGGGEVEDYPITVTWPPTPSMSLSKTVASGAVVTGGTITYTLTFTNTGNVPLTSVAVTDPNATVSGCTWSTVAPHTSVSCSATHPVTAADVTNGYVANTASAAARDQNNAAMTPVTSSVTLNARADAANDVDTTPISTTLSRAAAQGVLVNDLGRSISVTGFTALPAAQGTLTISANGSYTYVAGINFSGIATSTYTITDADGNTDTATLAITVKPTADADSGSTPIGSPITWTAATLLDGDLGTSLSVTSATNGTHGTTSVAGGGAVTYTPTSANYSGPDSFTYTVTDASGQTATATVTVNVTPTAASDTGATASGVTLTKNTASGVLANDHGTSLTVSAYDTIPTGQGTLTINTDGSYTYVPATGFSGVVTANYTARDASGQTVNSTLAITVSPTAVNDSDATVAGSAITRAASAGVLTNDLGTSKSVTGHNAIDPAKGTLTIGADGGYTFTPAAGFSGTVSSTYTVTDGAGSTATATLTILVTPRANPDAVTTTANTSVTITKAELINDDLGMGLTTQSATNGAHGTTSVAANGSITYTPAAGYSGADSYSYTVVDSSGNTATSTVTVTVTPVADADSGATAVGTPLSWSAPTLLAGDLGTDLEVTSATNGAHGTVTTNSSGTVTYTPTGTYSGPDAFTYTVTDASGQTATATVTVSITPVAVSDSASTGSGTTLTRDAAHGVLVNDKGTDLEVVSHTSPLASEGTLTIAADGSYTFAPAIGFSGSTTVNYTIEDASGQQTTATLTISVGIIANDDTDATTAGTPITRAAGAGVLLNDAGSGLTVSGNTAISASEGTLTIGSDGGYTFTPAAGFSGTVVSTYTIDDGHGHTDTATLTITVTPTAGPDSASTAAETPVTVTGTELLNDDAGSDLTVVGAANGAHGIVTIASNGDVTYTPANGFSGTDAFTYTVEDGEGQQVSATVTVTVTPVALNDTATTASGITVTRTSATGLLGNDTGSSLEVAYSTPISSSQGALTINADGSYEFVPAADYSGQVVTTYTVRDAEGQTTTATLAITVTPVAADDFGTTPAETPVDFDDLLANDHGTSLAIVSTTNGAHGTVAVADGVVTYTPEDGYSGSDSFTYTVRDGNGSESTAAVAVTVTPVAGPDAATTYADTPVTIAAASLTNDDLGTGLAVIDAANGSHGTVSVAANGDVTYTPQGGFSGTDAFTYTVEDAEGQQATATVNVTVVPTASNDSDATDAGVSVTRDGADGVLANDHGAGLAAVDFDAVPVSEGELTLNPDGGYTFTPAQGFSGTVTVTYVVEDGEGQQATAALTIVVSPVANGDSTSTSAGVPKALDDLVANDLGSDLDVTAVTQGSSGAVSLAGDDTVTYTPNPGFSGTDAFTYTVTDAEGRTSTATVNVTVTPVAVGDSATTDVEVPVSLTGLTSNDRGTGLEVTAVTQGGHGSVTLEDDGWVTYTPQDGFSGIDSFTYTVTDDEGQTSTAIVTVTVLPTAAADADATEINTALSRTAAEGVLVNDKGTDLVVLDYDEPAPTVGTLAIHPDGSYAFMPATGYSGVFRVDYTAEDAEGNTATSTLTISVGLKAADDVDSTTAGTAITRGADSGVLVNDAGSELEVIGFQAVPSAKGTLTVTADGSYEFTPADGFSGTVTSVYRVRDASGQEATANLTITVTPAAANNTAATTVGTPVTLTESVLLADDEGSELDVTSVTQGTNGSVVLNDDGSVTYTPSDGFSGTDTYTYTVTDAEGQTATATVTVAVTPVAANDSASTTAGTTLSRDADAGVLANDLGTSLQVASFTPVDPTMGTLTIAADGSFEFVPAAGFSGTVTSTYIAQDADDQQTTAVLTITVNPLAVDDNYATPFETPITIPLSSMLSNDLGTGLYAVSVYSLQNGSLGVVGSSLVFTPSPGFTGIGSFQYSLADAAGRTANATVLISVGPDANPDSDATGAGSAISRAALDGVLTNDVGDDLEVVSHETVPASQGVLEIGGDGSYTFTPAAGFSGTVTAEYTIRDTRGLTASSTLTIAVSPLGVDDDYATGFETPITIPLSSIVANDVGIGLYAVSVFSLQHGYLSVSGSGLQFTPDAGFTGVASFQYTAADSAGRTTVATVRIHVGIGAIDDDDATTAGTPISREASSGVLVNDVGDDLVVTGHDAVGPDKGQLIVAADGSYVFTPATGFSGTVTADYAIEDENGNTATATLTIVVTPLASADVDATAAGAAISRDASDGVLDNDSGSALTVVDHDTPGAGQGALTIAADGSYAFSPASGFSGTVTVEYTVEDAEGQQATSTLTITVTPVAAADSATTTVNTLVTRDAGAGVLANDEGSALTVVDAGMVDAAKGVLELNADGSYTFTPATDFSGTVEVEYTVEDGEGQQATATLTITVTPSGTADAASTASGTPVTITAATLLGNDHGTGLEISAVTAGTHGTVVLNPDGSVTYSPSGDFSGTDAFTYTALDEEAQPITVNVTVTVSPAATADHDETTGGTPISRDAAHGVLGNDNGSGLTVTSYDAVDSNQGAIVISPDGSFTFTPKQGFHGTVTITYYIEDEDGATASAVLTIIVGADLPLVAGDIASICVADVPYLQWDMALPAGFPDQGTAPLTITFVNPDGEDYVVAGLPLSGAMLWPGASNGSPKQWPGWKQLADGTYVETDGNFAWTRDGVTVLFKVNPEYQTTVEYPEATAKCANPAAALTDGDGSLSHTGMDSMGLLPIAIALIGAGLIIAFAGRRRRED